MRKNLKKLFSVGLFCLSLTLFAQQKPITGQVVDSDGFPVQDALVHLEGSDQGVYTDANGNYTIEAEPGDKVVVEYIGFDPKTIVVSNANNYNVKLSKGGTVKLKTVIATGYTTSSEDAYTGSADVVKAEDIKSKSTSNVTNALAGESAGVRVINSSGQPGTVGEINIRGIASVTGNRSPLYVVDGVPFSGSISSINPNDIASISILKDATATAIYGSRGANGVVVITTNSGKSGKSVIEYETKIGINTQLIPRYDVITSPEEYTELAWRSLKGYAQFSGESNPGLWASENLFGSKKGIPAEYNIWKQSGVDLIDPVTGKLRNNLSLRYKPESFRDAIKPAMRQEHNIKFSGGVDQTKFYASLGYLTDEGSFINSDYERLTARLNLDHKLNSWLSGNLNMGYSYAESNRNGQSSDYNSIFWFADDIPPIFPVYLRDKDGNKIKEKVFGGYLFDYGQEYERPFGLGGNPIGAATYDVDFNKSYDANIAASVNVDFTDYLRFENRFGAQFNMFVNDNLTNPFYGSDIGQNGYIYKRKNDDLSYNLLQMLKFDKKFGIHSLNAIAGHEFNNYRLNILNGGRSNIVDPNVLEWDNAAVFGSMGSYNVSYAIESYFGQVEYGYDKKYLLSASARRDGSSRFVNNKWGNFGSIGAAWVVSKEGFMANQKVFDYLKLKGSYGLTGEQSGVGYYPGYDLLTVGVINSKYLTIAPKELGNPDLTWQKAIMYQVGTEMRMFNNRVTLNLDYYKKTTSDMLFEKRIAMSTGNALYTVNDGELVNSGIEFDLGVNVFKKEDYFLKFNVNGEMINNELTKMPIDDTTKKQKILDVDGAYGRAVGHSVYDYFMPEWAGVDNTTGEAQWNIYYNDLNNNGKLDDGEAIRNLTLYMAENTNINLKKDKTKEYGKATDKFVGKSAVPKVRGAFSLRGGYKNIEVSAQFLYSLGGYSYDYTYAGLMSNTTVGKGNWHKDMLNSWTTENKNSDIPILSNGYSGQSKVNATSTRFLVKSDYIALNNVSVRYNFSNKVIDQLGLGGLSLFLSGDNLMVLSARKGFNPMTSTTGDTSVYRYNPMSTLSLGLNVKF